MAGQFTTPAPPGPRPRPLGRRVGFLAGSLAGFVVAGGLLLALAPTWLIADARPPAADLRKISEQERELVKKVYDARDQYQSALERLRAFYVHTNIEEQRFWAEKELTDFHLVLKSPYILEMDLPSLDLQADTSIPKANRIFREALEWLNKRSMSGTNENLHRAELLFRRLIRDYPRTDKLDEACYYLGEIYSSRYYQQYARAVAFYERVLYYSPNTNLDARVRAANLYEKYLNDHKRAVDLYQEVLRREVDPVQTKEARRRLDSLLGSKGPPRP